MDVRKITDPTFLKQLNENQRIELSQDIRDFLIQSLAKTGGHLSSNLGIVELTIALHTVFNSPQDKIFFDVGHQSYVHKILTGRASQFESLRQTGGISGFQKRAESLHDPWEAGHSSTALSAAVGMAVSRDLDEDKYDIIPVVGDGAMLGGASLEALNHLGSLPNKVILILNDNQMSIGKRVGNFGNFITDIRVSNTYNTLKNDYRLFLYRGKVGKYIYHVTSHLKQKIKKSISQSTVFDDFGTEYIGPIDGHDFHDLIRALKFAKKSKHSVVIHVITKKGKGYSFAEDDQCGNWHGTGPFDIHKGQIQKTDSTKISWSKVVSERIELLMEKDPSIVAITPAMIHGSAMGNLFNKYPNRCFDVGIAEQHALTFVAGLSVSNKKPFISVYSSFIQRAYDQINHDIARMNLPCFVCIDRAGIVGSDGPTHHGVFDISLFSAVPNLVLFAPKNAYEAYDYMNLVFLDFTHPYFMRIPRNDVYVGDDYIPSTMSIGTWTCTTTSSNPSIIIITYGDNVERVEHLCRIHTIDAIVVNARFIKPIDTVMLDQLCTSSMPILVYETDLEIGGLNQQVSSYLHMNNRLNKLYTLGIKDHYSMQGSIQDIYHAEGIDDQSFLNKVKEICNGKGTN